MVTAFDANNIDNANKINININDIANNADDNNTDYDIDIFRLGHSLCSIGEINATSTFIV